MLQCVPSVCEWLHCEVANEVVEVASTVMIHLCVCA